MCVLAFLKAMAKDNPLNCILQVQEGVIQDWTKDHREMGYNYYWASDDSVGQEVARDHGLGEATPIMYSGNETGTPLFIFKADGQFYVWNEIEGEIFHIEELKDDGAVEATIRRSGFNNLTLTKVYQTG